MMSKPVSAKDLFGFRFWLGWIISFAAAFILSAVFWTWLLTRAFGAIRGGELTLSWCVAVFGSWFLFLVPFMRKKERIWKRLNADQEKAADLWLAGIGVMIGGLIASTAGWSWVYRSELHREAAGFHAPWIKAVLATWMAGLIPFLILMYRRADALFREAHARQTAAGPAFKTGFVEKSRRLLPPEVSRQTAAFPETLENGKVVRLTLKDGREIPHAFVLNSREILGLYDCGSMDFDAADVVRVQGVPPEALPAFEEARWLRLDGRA